MKRFNLKKRPGFQELSVQYSDYAVYQREVLFEEVYQTQLDYWRHKLTGLPVLELPSDYPRPLEQTHRGAVKRLILSQRVTQEVRDLSKSTKSTVFITLLSALKLVLYRFSGQEDFSVGSPIAGRTTAGVERLIGLFLNTLVLRTKLDGNPTFLEVLTRVRRTAVEAYANQDVPFEMLLNELKPRRDLSRTPFFQVFFNMLNLDRDPFSLADMEVERLQLGDPHALFDLTLYVQDLDGQIRVSFVYNADLFSAETIQNILDGFAGLIEQVVENPDRRINRYDFVMPENRALIYQAPDPTSMAPAKILEQEIPATIEPALTEIWEDLLGIANVEAEDDFFDLGGHSLLSIRMFSEIEKSFGVKLPLATLFRSPTLRALSHEIAHGANPADWQTLVRIQPHGDRTPFFCVHGFGGGVIGYSDLAAELGNDQPFIGLQASGFDGRQAVDTDVRAMAARYLETIKEIQPHGPYLLGGYCFGGVVAFEMAFQLQEQGEKAALVAIFEGFAPRRGSEKEQIWNKPSLILNFFQNLPFWFRDFIRLGFHGMWSRIARRGRIFRNGLRRAFGRDVEVNLRNLIDRDIEHIPEIHQELMEIHIRAMMQYSPKPLTVGVDLFRVRSRSPFRTPDPLNGWGRLTAEGVTLHRIEGMHHNILERPFVDVLAAELHEAIDRAIDNPADQTNLKQDQ